MKIELPRVVLATPRGLPRVDSLGARVVVLDIAFASTAGGQSFEAITLRFIERLGARLCAWVDHHDSLHHALFSDDARFVLRSKAQHPACPELVTADLVARIGPVDTIVCHGDFDGLVSAAKWLRHGEECYPGCDADARAIDSRMGVPSARAARIDRAIRGSKGDRGLLLEIVAQLHRGEFEPSFWQRIDRAGEECARRELQAEAFAEQYQPAGPHAVWLELEADRADYDKTWLLLEGQKRARIALVVDADTITLAAPFDSGIDFVASFGLSGGMPTVLSMRRERLAEVLAALRDGLGA